MNGDYDDLDRALMALPLEEPPAGLRESILASTIYAPPQAALVLRRQQTSFDPAALEVDDPRKIRLADDAIRVDDVDQKVLNVAGGAVKLRADLVSLALELVTLPTVVLEHHPAASE